MLKPILSDLLSVLESNLIGQFINHLIKMTYKFLILALSKIFVIFFNLTSLLSKNTTKVEYKTDCERA